MMWDILLVCKSSARGILFWLLQDFSSLVVSMSAGRVFQVLFAIFIYYFSFDKLEFLYRNSCLTCVSLFGLVFPVVSGWRSRKRSGWRLCVAGPSTSAKVDASIFPPSTSTNTLVTETLKQCFVSNTVMTVLWDKCPSVEDFRDAGCSSVCI